MMSLTYVGHFTGMAILENCHNQSHKDIDPCVLIKGTPVECQAILTNVLDLYRCFFFRILNWAPRERYKLRGIAVDC